MVFQYSPAGFEQYFIENGTLVGTAPKQRTPEEYAATEEKYGMIYKTTGLNNQNSQEAGLTDPEK